MSKNKVSKKQKILAGVCIPLATAGVAAGVAGIFLMKKTPVTPSKGDYKVSFYTDESAHFVDDTNSEQRVYSGTTLDRILKPTVESYKASTREYKPIFTGWNDEKGVPVPGKYKISRDTKLTASFGNSLSGDFYTLTFKVKPEETSVSLHGNVSVGVKKGYKFLMVNRPTAEWGDNYFECWQYKDSDGNYVDIDESTVLESDMTLYPRFTKAVTITWNPGDGGSIQRGQATTRLSAGTKFDKFNQPQLVNSDLNMVFKEWVKSDGATPWKADDIVSEDAVAIAKWQPSQTPQSTDRHTLLFEQNKETGAKVEVIFAPSTTTIIDVSGEPGYKYWSEVVKPDVYTDPTDYELESWEYLDDSETPNVWRTLSDDHKFSSDEATGKYSTRIRPVMKSSITGVTISGESTVLPESSNTYNAVVSGTKTNESVTQTVTWKLYSDKACSQAVDASIATINEATGQLIVKSLTVERDLYIKATPTASGTTYTAVYPVHVEMPYVKSQKIWYHNGTQWFSMSQRDGICDNTRKDITATALNSSYGSETQKIVKSDEFTNKIYIGRQLTELFDEFGYNWYGFNGEIDFGTNLRKIGSSFFENNELFNKKLDLTYITEIGDAFLCNASGFGIPEIGTKDPYESLITFGLGLHTIGDRFLMGCSNYNRKLVLPKDGESGSAAELSIGESFMYGCTSFNQDFEIPANVVAINDFFMYDCNNFTSKLTVNADIEAAMLTSSIYICSSSTSGADIYNLGFTVDGSYASAFNTYYPTHNSDYSYRRISTEESKGKAVTSGEFAAAYKKLIIDSTSTSYAGKNFTVESDALGDTISFATNSNNGLIAQARKGANGYTYEQSVYGDGTSTTLPATNYTWKRYDSEANISVFCKTQLKKHLTVNSDSWYGLLNGFLSDIANHPYSTWTWNENTGKYTLTDNFTVTVRGMELTGLTCQLEFDDSKNIRMATISKTGSDEKYTFTFSKYGTTAITYPSGKTALSDYNFGKLEQGTTPSTTEVVTKSAMTYNLQETKGEIQLMVDLSGLTTITGEDNYFALEYSTDGSSWQYVDKNGNDIMWQSATGVNGCNSVVDANGNIVKANAGFTKGTFYRPDGTEVQFPQCIVNVEKCALTQNHVLLLHFVDENNLEFQNENTPIYFRLQRVTTEAPK